MPQDRVDYVRSAFDKVVALEEFRKQSALRWKYQPPVGGKDYAADMEKTLSIATPDKYQELLQLVDKNIR